ncbi:MAG: hypothetical protein V3U76_04780 [Granulosicoccus sp.]
MTGSSLQRLDEHSLAAACEKLAAVDPVLSALLDKNGTPPLWQRDANLRSLVYIVIEQKISLSSAKAVMRRVDTLCPVWSADALLAVSAEELRAAGLSTSKVAYCHGIAQAVNKGSLNFEQLNALPDNDVMSALLKIRGIGPWTAGVYLVMALGRPDIWPSGDRALAVGVQEAWQLTEVPDYPALDKLAIAWQPWRAVAARIIWHAYLSQRTR